MAKLNSKVSASYYNFICTLSENEQPKTIQKSLAWFSE